MSRERPPGVASGERDEGPGDTAILTIDLDALAANYRRLRDLAAPAECAAVVKADAYGLGMAADRARALARRLQDLLRGDPRARRRRCARSCPTPPSMCSPG